MNLLDGILVVIIAASTYYGIRHGLVLEIFALVAVLAGSGAGIAYHDLVAKPLEGWLNHAGAARFLGFAAVFLVVGAAVFVLGRWARAFVHAVFLGWVDALAGGIIGFLKGVLAAWAILTLGVAYLPWAGETAKASRLAPSLLEISDYSDRVLPEEVNKLIEDRMVALRKVWAELEKP